MKCSLISIIMLTAATTCCAQSYTYYGGFSPQGSDYFRVPVGTKVYLTTTLNWGGEPLPAPDITPGFIFDSSSITILSASGSSQNGVGSVTLSIVVQSDTPGCYDPFPGIVSYYDSAVALAGYEIEGFYFNPNIIGKVTGPDSLTFYTPILTGSKAEGFINIVNDSFGLYHPITVISVNLPFSFDDTIRMMYQCESDYSYCSFHPTAPGHYVDTAKLLDELTNDTISVVLIGDAYDAGVSDVPAPQVKLYPNPCDRELQIESLTDESAEIEIYNLFGECVYRSTPQDNNAAIDCSDLPAGVYFVSISGMASHLTQKLIVAH